MMAVAKPNPIPVHLTLVGTQGRITPGIVVVNSDERHLVIINDEPEVEVTVVLPHGVSTQGTVFHLGGDASNDIDITIAPEVARHRQIPYQVFFHRRLRDGTIDVHDWGVANSPPTMVLEP